MNLEELSNEQVGLGGGEITRGGIEMREISDHIPDAGKKVGDHIVDGNKTMGGDDA